MGNTLKFCRNQMLRAPVCTVYGISLRRGTWRQAWHQKSTRHHLELRLELFIKIDGWHLSKMDVCVGDPSHHARHKPRGAPAGMGHGMGPAVAPGQRQFSDLRRAF